MSRGSRFVIGLLGWLFSIGFTLLVIGGGAAVLMFNHYSKDLPDYSQLAQYNPPALTRLYASDGRLMAEYASQKRVFVPLAAIPKRVINAFLSAEDKHFYAHEGIDFTGIARAIRDNINHYGQGKSMVGGSTITQQVVKNFLLSNEKSIERKIKEAILAMRITQVYSKDKILELYLNEIYLGLSSYGVAVAGQNYFNKSLDDLTIEEAALLAAEPKSPYYYDPRRYYDNAKERRDWVIDRMQDGGHITAQEARDAKDAPIVLRRRDPGEVAHADYFAEEVRRQLADMYGLEGLYEDGLVVRTTLDPVLQQYADAALRKALIDYDRRRGYRGKLAHIEGGDPREQLVRLTQEHAYHLLENQKLAVVTGLDAKKATILFADGTDGALPFSLMKWTRRIVSDGVLGPAVSRPADILKLGDVVITGPLDEAQARLLTEAERKSAHDLQQVPEVNGALVALDPHTGRVLAMSGGYAFGGTEFNRATQARRQPGSSFKPFVYAAGLESGFTPSTVIMDAPVEMSQGAGMPAWSPQNYHDEYLGPTTMRIGLEKSRNTMTVRLAQMIGIDKVLRIGKRFGIYDEPPRNFSIVLGASETTLMRLSGAYGMLANGGKRIVPSLIERIDDRNGVTVYRRDSRVCDKCRLDSIDGEAMKAPPPIPPDAREQILDPRVAYQMNSMLEGVALRGTGAAAHVELRKTVAGKTGTTNDSNDTWFIGYTPDLVAGVFVGYDKPRTMGRKETGASVALPGFIAFMKQAIRDKPDKPFRVPPGIQLVKVDLHSGQAVTPDLPPEGRVISEAFVTGGPIFIPGVVKAAETGGAVEVTPPGGEPQLLPPPVALPPAAPPVVGTGGLY